ncbi:glycoside hydrolase family 76 protein [Cohnella candidum]|uniref:glycoside hydrolase family 76 protein n=1 Tax=Cohnella candidum TaxID=2674991 RepID=UPI001F150107|nr:glycoside hydrolase family 76 protein [Cohnella candidum]
MKRRNLWIWITVPVAVLTIAAAVFGKASWAEGMFQHRSSVWSERAELAQDELSASFWDGKRKLYNNASPCILQLCTDPFNYWWLAHVVDLSVDGYLRTGATSYKERIQDLYDGILSRNAGVWPNDYYDDMAWMGLAWLRAFDAVGDDKYKAAALALWEDIKGGWNEEMGGGIAWRKEQTDYKNAPANAPSAILAARLYARFGNKDDLAWAERIYQWEKNNLVDPDTGLVWDGMNRNGDGLIDKDWTFTYNQGTFIGAGVELYRATKKDAYLEDAAKTADYAADRMASPTTGMLPSEGDGDGALFKGVLVRYWGELVREKPGNEKWLNLLRRNAESLWEQGRKNDRPLFGLSWSQTPDDVVPLSADISGTALLEVMASLEKQGWL